MAKLHFAYPDERHRNGKVIITMLLLLLILMNKKIQSSF